MVRCYNIDGVDPQELSLLLPDHHLAHHPLHLLQLPLPPGGRHTALEQHRHLRLPRTLPAHLRHARLVHRRGRPHRPRQSPPPVGLFPGVAGQEILPHLPCVQAGAHAPLLGVREVRAQHGPPLSLDQRLHRLQEPQALHPDAGLHHPGHPREHGGRAVLAVPAAGGVRVAAGGADRGGSGGGDRAGAEPGDHGDHLQLPALPPEAHLRQPDHHRDAGAGQAGQEPGRGGVALRPRQVLQLGAGVRHQQLDVAAAGVPAGRGAGGRRGDLAAQEQQKLIHLFISSAGCFYRPHPTPTPPLIIINAVTSELAGVHRARRAPGPAADRRPLTHATARTVRVHQEGLPPEDQPLHLPPRGSHRRLPRLQVLEEHQGDCRPPGTVIAHLLIFITGRKTILAKALICIQDAKNMVKMASRDAVDWLIWR